MCWLIYWNPLSHKYPMTFDIYCLIPWVILTLFLIIFHLFCFVFDTFLLPTADRLSKIILRKNITCLKVFKLFSASCLSPFSSCNLYKSEKWQKINHILMKKRQYFAATTDRTWICWIHFSRFSWKGNLCIIAHAPQSNSQRSFPRDGGHTHTHTSICCFHLSFMWSSLEWSDDLWPSESRHHYSHWRPCSCTVTGGQGSDGQWTFLSTEWLHLSTQVTSEFIINKQRWKHIFLRRRRTSEHLCQAVRYLCVRRPLCLRHPHTHSLISIGSQPGSSL